MSLAHQINDDRTVCYGNNEIVDYVLKATLPDLCLRNVLETMESLSLDTLLRFSKGYLEEENAQDMCSQLTPKAQLSDETAVHFVIRCLKMFQKVIITQRHYKGLASKQSDNINDDPNLVEQVFLRTLEKSIVSLNVFSEIRPHLK